MAIAVLQCCLNLIVMNVKPIDIINSALNNDDNIVRKYNYLQILTYYAEYGTSAIQIILHTGCQLRGSMFQYSHSDYNDAFRKSRGGVSRQDCLYTAFNNVPSFAATVRKSV